MKAHFITNKNTYTIVKLAHARVYVKFNEEPMKCGHKSINGIIFEKNARLAH